MIMFRLSRYCVYSLVLVSVSVATAATPEELLDHVHQNTLSGSYGLTDSLLIWHGEELLLEEYYRGYEAANFHRMYSTTKSVASALIGIAIEQGAIEGVDRHLLDYFPDYTPANLDERKEAITLEHLLNMQAGFEWDEDTLPYTAPGNSVYDMTQVQRDWMEYVVDQPMSGAPGTEYAYNSGVSLLLSRILSESTGQTTRQFAEENLFSELGINTIGWTETPQGETNTGWGLWLRPIDMIRLGRLYLNDGYWQPTDGSPGKQIVPSEWVEASTRPYAEEGMPGYAGIAPLNYGYQWWMFREDAAEVSNLAVNDLYFSWGWGAQFIIVVPHLDLVVATTGSNYDLINTSIRDVALPDYIIPAIQQLAADLDDDDNVDGNDFLAWQRGESPHPLSNADLSNWQVSFGAAGTAAAAFRVPEPNAILLLPVFVVLLRNFGFERLSRRGDQR